MTAEAQAGATARPAAVVRAAGAAWLDGLVEARGRLLPWAPVFLGAGIGAYFALPVEPTPLALAVFGLVALLGLGLRVAGGERLHAPGLALALIAGGVLLAAGRSHLVAAPVLPWRTYGAVEGRVVDIDRSFSDQIRITLDRVGIAGLAPERTPLRVRIALHGDAVGEPAMGARVRALAHLAPPEGPVAPGGFDFQRLAWFAGLGGVGYTRKPVETLAPPEGGPALAIARLRSRLSQAMRAAMPSQAGAFATAMMTGDRSGVTAETNAVLRASNLSHLISISGLHMSLLTGFVFAVIRTGLALIPPLALRLPVKKIAATVALATAAFYLALSGGDVATRRAFLMVAVMLAAVLFDRRALSLRSVAIAALVVLALEPESLVEPGFQMSFGATVALVWAFGHWTRVQPRVPAALRPVAVAVLSSAVAGFATAPIAAAHFNRIAEYGLLANLLAVPLMGLVVMPSGVLAAVLAPIGLAAPALWLMEQGTALVLRIARFVADLDGAVVGVPAPAAGVLPVLTVAALTVMLARGRVLSALAGAAMVAALAAWASTPRPPLLVGPDAALVGLMTPAGRALSKEKGAGFIAQSWLEDDGDLSGRETAASRPGFDRSQGRAVADFGAGRVVHLWGKAGLGAVHRDCRPDTILVLAARWEGAAPRGGCLFLDLGALAGTGALAITPGADGGLAVVTAIDPRGRRLWNAPRR